MKHTDPNTSTMRWRPIETFDGTTFILISDTTPEGTEVFKYKGWMPDWAVEWFPLYLIRNIKQ